MQRFRGGLVLKAHGLVNHSTRLENNKEEETDLLVVEGLELRQALDYMNAVVHIYVHVYMCKKMYTYT
jgi:hypothetical protein